MILGNRIVLWLRLSPHGYAGTHEEACGVVGRHLVGDRCGGSGPTRLLWLVAAELRWGGDGRRHGRGRTPELSGGQPQSKVPISAAFELSGPNRTDLGGRYGEQRIALAHSGRCGDRRHRGNSRYRGSPA